jgi:ATP-dependent helicase HrpB
VVPELRAALAAGHAVLSAPPGSGKTTHVPLALLTEPWLGGRIPMLEPRRPATCMTAARMADLRTEAIGETVGYQVRFDRRIGQGARIEVLTEGYGRRRWRSGARSTYRRRSCRRISPRSSWSSPSGVSTTR